MQIVSAFLAALIFGIGLIASGMSNPAKVLAFLDIAGRWDPSLALVMAGAIAVAAPAFAFAGKRGRTLAGAPIKLPDARKIDPRLIGGSLMFGVGWGIAGICPGPALVLVGSLNAKGIAFSLAMMVGMQGFAWIEKRRSARAC